MINGIATMKSLTAFLLLCATIMQAATFTTPARITSFVGSKAVENGRYATAAEIKVEGSELVISVQCQQPKSSVQALATVHDRDVFRDDCIEIYIDTEGRGKDFYQYIINPLGTLQDLQHTRRKWDSNGKASGSVCEDGWNVEMRIPLSELACENKVEDGQVCININICRSVPGCAYGESLLEGGAYSMVKKFPTLRLNGVTPQIMRSEFLEMLQQKKIDTTAIEKLNGAEFYAQGRALELKTLQSRYNTLPEGIAYYFPTKTNVLPNPRFEYVNFREEPANWMKKGNGTAQCGKEGLLLKSAGKVELWQENQPVLDNTREYAIRAKVRSVSGSNRFSVNLYGVNRNVKFLGVEKIVQSLESPVCENNGKWTDVEYVFSLPKSAFRGEAGIIVEGGELQVKDVELDLLGKEYAEIIVSQLGYHSKGYKDAIFWSRKGGLTPDFELLKNGKVVFKGKAKLFPGKPYDRETYVADFSEVKGEGKYRLKTNGMLSNEFQIGKNVYREGMRFLLNGFYYQRQGFAQPGWKSKPDYIDDAYIVNDKARVNPKLLYAADGSLNPAIILGHRDFSGGWRDAGDPSKQGMDGDSIYNLARVIRALPLDWKLRKQKLPDFPDEMWWGCSRWVEKCHLGDGTFLGATVNDTNNGPWVMRVPENCTDGIVGNKDDRIVFAETGKDGKYVGNIGNQWVHYHAIGLAGLALKKYDPAITAKCIDVMEKYYVKLLGRYDNWGLEKKKTWARYDLGRCAGKIAYSAIYLHQLTGKQEYKDMADKMLARIADMAITMDYRKFEMDQSFAQSLHYFNVLLEYAEFYPNSQLMPQVKKAIATYIDNMILPGFDMEALFPVFNYYRLLAKYGKKVPSKGITCISTNAMHTLYRAGKILGDRNYDILAEKTVQFWLGRNPQNLCEISGLGWRHPALMTGLSGNEAHADAIIPGIMANGFRTRGGMPMILKPAAVNPGGTTDTSYGSEAWIYPTGLMIALMGDLEAAYSRK